PCCGRYRAARRQERSRSPRRIRPAGSRGKEDDRQASIPGKNAWATSRLPLLLGLAAFLLHVVVQVLVAFVAGELHLLVFRVGTPAPFSCNSPRARIQCWVIDGGLVFDGVGI